jgi:hypothetical protein
MSLDALLDNIYNTTADETAIEKTAEARLFDALSDGQDELTGNPYESLSVDELVKLANESGLGDGGHAEDEADGMTKEAYEVLCGQQMAHASIHEMSLIKVALANGLCRACKTHALDVQGSSICSDCLQG